MVYNKGWSPSGNGGYPGMRPYRENGGSEAAKVGAVAALVQSATEHSLYTLHTGKSVGEPTKKTILYK